MKGKNHSILQENTTEVKGLIVENSGNPGKDAMKKLIACAKLRNCGPSDYVEVADLSRQEAALRYIGCSPIKIKALSAASGKAKAAASFGKLLKFILDKLLENASTRSKISIHNRLTQTLKCTGTHSYQMNLWDNQFPDLPAWHGKDVDTWTSGNTVGWGDTNAEAYYTVWCPQWNRNLKFTIMIRHQHWIRFKWDEQDVYNPCYDMWVEGKYHTREDEHRRRGQRTVTHTIASSWSPILVVGSAEVPNKDTHVTLKLKPHVADSRFPVLYEHSNFHGTMHPITLPFMANLAGFNDKASSLRVPPGMLVALCEHDKFGGNCHTYSGDTAQISMNDAATSAIWYVDAPGK
jgi:hypothetical protein